MLTYPEQLIEPPVFDVFRVGRVGSLNPIREKAKKIRLFFKCVRVEDPATHLPNLPNLPVQAMKSTKSEGIA